LEESLDDLIDDTMILACLADFFIGHLGTKATVVSNSSQLLSHT
jgi:hypothetical protein